MRTRAAIWASSLGLLLCAVGVGIAQTGDGQSMPRGPVSLAGQEAVLVSPAVLSVSVPSCTGEPVVDRLEENAHQVAIRVKTVPAEGAQNLCIDDVRVELERALGSRQVIDLESRDVLPIVEFGGVLTVL